MSQPSKHGPHGAGDGDPAEPRGLVDAAGEPISETIQLVGGRVPESARALARAHDPESAPIPTPTSTGQTGPNPMLGTGPIPTSASSGLTGPNPILGTGPIATVALPGEPPRRRAYTLFGEGGPIRRFLGRWGFPLFVLLIIAIGRNVLLPFVFAALVAYILAPVVRRMSERANGTRRMPRGLAIIICYIAILAAIAGFLFLLVPRLAGDVQRIGMEAPSLYRKINDDWTPSFARWAENRFPSLRAPRAEVESTPIVSDVPLPPGTAFTVTPLPDGRLAVQLTPGGVEVKPGVQGSFHLLSHEAPPEPITLEEKVRTWAGKAMSGAQSQLTDLVRFGQRVIGALIKGVFTFFLVLMIGAFILLDMEKVHAFLRSLFPPNVRGDYDVIIDGINRGLSGVIRGQLLICLINGALTYVGLRVFDVKYSLILAMVAAIMSLIPIFGSILSTLPIVVASLVSGDAGLDIVRAIAMTLWIIGIHFLEANFLNPKIIGTAAKIHPVLVIFSLILGEHSYGLVGALLAVPLLSMIQVLFVFFYRKTWKEAPRPPAAGSHPA